MAKLIALRRRDCDGASRPASPRDRRRQSRRIDLHDPSRRDRTRKTGRARRGPHVHHGFEECIHVLAGQGDNAHRRRRPSGRRRRHSAWCRPTTGTRPTIPAPPFSDFSASSRSATSDQRQSSSRHGIRWKQRDDARRALPPPADRLHPRRRRSTGVVARNLHGADRRRDAGGDEGGGSTRHSGRRPKTSAELFQESTSASCKSPAPASTASTLAG